MRKSSLSQSEIENFWIRCYLNPSGNFREAAIDRAYRDFNRTLHGIRKDQTTQKHSQLKQVMNQVVSEVLSTSFDDQSMFDQWHEAKCNTLIAAYQKVSNHRIFIGQAQKWINMALKYLYALGENRIQGISQNYEYFHFPFDNIIIQKLAKHGFKKFKVAWSRIDNYKDYIQFQIKMRDTFKGQIPLDVEFRLYNE